MSDNSLNRLDETLKAYSSSHEGNEDSIISILIQGSDTSGMNRTLYYKITSSPKNGKLIDPDSGRYIKAGNVLNQTDPHPWDGLIVNFKGNPNFFTHPHTQSSDDDEVQYHDSFEFVINI